ncbi:MAG: hypothetical protein K6T61_14040 [Bryobacteraceae bacterium]|nr:hypothetical protein [Bryobacteraceae bacterium]
MRKLLAVVLLASAPLAAQVPPETQPQPVTIEFLLFDAAQTAGKRSTCPFAVRVARPDGTPVAGARVSFRLIPSPASGRFASGLPVEIAVTDPSGVAQAGHVHWDAQPGRVHLHVIAAVDKHRAERLQSIELAPPQPSSFPLRAGRRAFWVLVGSAGLSTLAGLAWAKK